MCFDETSRQLTGEVRPPLAAAPGRVARYDTEYQRNGTRNRFMICEPRGGGRQVAVTERRTAVDFAHQMRWLVEEAYPDAQVVRLVLKNWMSDRRVMMDGFTFRTPHYMEMMDADDIDDTDLPVAAVAFSSFSETGFPRFVVSL